MLYRRAWAFWSVAIVTLLTLRAEGQSVISTRSGVVHFFEGNVYLDNQPLESHLGKFSTVPRGGELRAVDGHAEVLLTPGVFVRIGERSAIRMVDNELSHTRVELLKGSAVVDSAKPISGTSVTLIYGSWSVRFLEHGLYRVDSDPPRLWVLQGRAEVCDDRHESRLVGQGMNVPLRPVLAPEQTIEAPRDTLSTWAEGRQQSISADNAIAANIQDPASIEASNSGLDGFTYFPMLGLSSLGLNLSTTYRSLGLYQSGFNSLYLPGYTFLPSPLGLGAVGFFPLRFPWRPHPIPVLPVYPHPLPTRPVSPYSTPLRPIPIPVVPVYSHPIPVRPVSPRPAPVRPAPPLGVHGGNHR
jgi:hypothetical protein